MARSTFQKQWAIDHENYVASQLGGRRTKNSGATDSQKGDVDRVSIPDLDVLVECKYTGEVTKPAKSISVKLDVLEKITDEAQMDGCQPMLALRITNPDSPIASARGHVDWVALPIGDLEYLLDLAKSLSAGNT